MRPKVTFTLVSSLLLAGCAWNALYVTPSVAPVQVALIDFKKPYPGKYLLLVSGTGLNQKVAVGGLVCTSHDFFVEIERSFEQSVQETLANVVEEIEVVSAPLTKKQIRAAKARALITVKAESLVASLLVSPGFFTKESQAKVNISARLQVLRKKGRLFDKKLRAENSTALTIGKCLDGFKPVTAASTKALQQLVEKIGNSVAQSLSSRK